MLDEELEHEAPKKNDTAAQKRKRLKGDIVEVLRTAAGRHVIERILETCQVEGINGGHDVVSMARIEGKRAVGLQIIQMLRSHDRDGWLKLYAEIYDDR